MAKGYGRGIESAEMVPLALRPPLEINVFSRHYCIDAISLTLANSNAISKKLTRYDVASPSINNQVIS